MCQKIVNFYVCNEYQHLIIGLLGTCELGQVFVFPYFHFCNEFKIRYSFGNPLSIDIQMFYNVAHNSGAFLALLVFQNSESEYLIYLF